MFIFYKKEEEKKLHKIRSENKFIELIYFFSFHTKQAKKISTTIKFLSFVFETIAKKSENAKR